MPDYKNMYFSLYKKVGYFINELALLQQELEEEYINARENNVIQLCDKMTDDDFNNCEEIEL